MSGTAKRLLAVVFERSATPGVFAGRSYVATDDAAADRMKVPGVVLRSKTTASSRFAVPDIKGLGGEEAVQTFAISGGWRIVGRCR